MCLLESPFLEPLLRTLLRTLSPFKTHCERPSKNPSQNLLESSRENLLRTLLRSVLSHDSLDVLKRFLWRFDREGQFWLRLRFLKTVLAVPFRETQVAAQRRKSRSIPEGGADFPAAIFPCRKMPKPRQG